MKKVVLCLLLSGAANLILSAQVNASLKREVLLKAVQALKSKDREAYSSCGFSRTDFKSYLLELKGIKDVAPEMEKGLDSIIDENYPVYIKHLQNNFANILRKTPQINWSAITIDSVQFNPEKGKNNSGCIFMRHADNSFFYKMNFEELLYFNGRYYLQSLLIPYVDDGGKNRLLTKDLKNAYVDSCISRNKRQASMVRDKKLQGAIAGKCPKCDCERQYISDTDQKDGVSRVKNLIGFSFPAKKK